MIQLTFCGRRASIYAKTKIKNARASELAASINKGYEKASKDIGRKVKPLRQVSGKSLIEVNENCFDSYTKKLNQEGREGFDSIYPKLIQVSTESNLGQFIEGVRNFVKKTVTKDGKVFFLFDQIHK